MIQKFCLLLMALLITAPWSDLTVEADESRRESGGSVGKSFMPREGVKYRMGERDLDQPLPLPLKVFAEDQDWLYVTGGRVRKTDVVALEKAADYYEELLRKNPQNSWALCQRGILVGNDGELDSARADFEQAIASDPKNAEAHAMRGVLHATNEDYDAAIKDFTEAIRIRPDYADAYHQRGYCYSEDLNDEAKAIADYSAAIAACPEFSEAYAGRALVYQYQLKAREALTDYDKAIELDPYNIDSLANRAMLKAASSDESVRDGKSAVADAMRACKLTNDEDSDVLTTLAAAHAETGNFEEAVKVQMKAALLANGQERIERLKKIGLYREKKPYRYEDEIKELKELEE
jgi:tetratricopeptide (TPR) repeat protein